MSEDPFAALEEAANRLKTEESAANAVQKGLVKLILGKDAKSPFFATLGLRLKPSPNWDIPTACVDGANLEYNPEFIEGLDKDQIVGLLGHEVMHCAGKHFARRGGRDPKRFNVAADLEINPVLRDCGFELPADGCFPGEGQFKDLPLGENAEKYYDLLPDEDDGDGQSGDDPGGCGGVKDAGDKAKQRTAAAEMDVAVMQAAETAKGRGDLPGGIARMVDKIAKPKVDWRSVLREFVSEVAKNDYNWTPPNRRYIHLGLYLPSMRSEELGDVTLAVDTSGSIGEKELNRFASEAQGIFETYKCSVHVIYHDSSVQSEEHWEASDGDLRLAPQGGGGTDHIPVFDHIRKTGQTPNVLVCLTDCDSSYPTLPPDYPVIWCRAGRYKGSPPPWGRLVDVEI